MHDRCNCEPTNMPKTYLRQDISIDALPSKVWKVLTHADYTSQYFPDGIQCNWIEGSRILMRIENKYSEEIDKGLVLEAVPGMVLKYCLQEDRAINTIITTYRLIPGNNAVELKIYLEGFIDTEEDYQLRMQQVKLLLQKIKWLAEYG